MGAPEILVAADDRTGALEAAGTIADAVGEWVPAVAGVERLPGEAGRTVVVDLASRHRTTSAARRLARDLDRVPATRHVHKIDSTLRGNWAQEVVARSRRGSRPVLLVPALPGLGRTCEGGVVLVDGRPVDQVAAADPLGAPASARPADLLRWAGAPDVTHLTADDVASWAEEPVGIAVCDARDDAELARAVLGVRHRPGVLLAGPASVARRAAELNRGARRAGVTAPERPLARSCLVVCGSLHPVARAQVAGAVARGAHLLDDGFPPGGDLPAGRPVILVPPSPPVGPVPHDVAAEVAARLGRRAAELIVRVRPDALVLVGGDTAAAVLGEVTVRVGGLVEPGAPWGIDPGGRLVVTRAGGFGGPDALDRLIRATLRS